MCLDDREVKVGVRAVGSCHHIISSSSHFLYRWCACRVTDLMTLTKFLFDSMLSSSRTSINNRFIATPNAFTSVASFGVAVKTPDYD